MQVAALLIAAKRADPVASEIAIHTEKNTEDLKTGQRNTALTAEVKKNTDLLGDIQQRLTMALAQLPRPPAGTDAS